MAGRRIVGLLVGSAVVCFARIAGAQATSPAPETIAIGEWQLAPSLDLRARGEYSRDPVDVGGIDADSGTISRRVRDSGGVLERSRVGLDAQRGALEARVVLQDARAWGATSTTGVAWPGGA